MVRPIASRDTIPVTSVRSLNRVIKAILTGSVMRVMPKTVRDGVRDALVGRASDVREIDVVLPLPVREDPAEVFVTRDPENLRLLVDMRVEALKRRPDGPI